MKRQKLKKEISERKVRQIMRHAFHGEVKIKSISLLKGGFFNTCYKVTFEKRRPVILRISPSREKALLGHERALLRREAGLLSEMRKGGIPVPRILFRDFTGRVIPRDYIIMEYREGANWFSIQKKLKKPENSGLYRELGRMARQIHHIRRKKKAFGFPSPFRTYKSWGLFMQEVSRMIVRDMRKYSLKQMADDVNPLALACRMRTVFDEVTFPCLLHGDLWPRNVLVVKEGGCRISALFDCERGLWGDPSFEWVFHCWDMPPSFWKGYGKNRRVSASDHKRHLFYKAYYLLVASLEEILHFRRRKNHLSLFHRSESVLKALKKALSNRSSTSLHKPPSP